MTRARCRSRAATERIIAAPEASRHPNRFLSRGIASEQEMLPTQYITRPIRLRIARPDRQQLHRTGSIDVDPWCCRIWITEHRLYGRIWTSVL